MRNLWCNRCPAKRFFARLQTAASDRKTLGINNPRMNRRRSPRGAAHESSHRNQKSKST